jgi:hypothetical protein
VRHHRYPADLPVTLDDFHACGWKTALESELEKDFGYPTLWSHLSRAAAAAMEEGRQAQGKVLWLIADACSMMLQPSSVGQPFRPFCESAKGRSAMPEDFGADDLGFFAAVLEHVDHPLVRARLADLLWLVGAPRDIAHARIAIDSYRQVPLAPENWYRGGHECWRRALSLALAANAGAGTRLSEMELAIVDRLLLATFGERFFGVQLAQMLRECRLGKGHSPNVAQKLEALAREFDAYFEEATLWVSDEERCAEMAAAAAETLVKEADARKSDDGAPSHMVANMLYAKAIEAFRTIPRKLRAKLAVDERIARLRELHGDAGVNALGEFGVFRSPPVDITGMVARSRSAIAGKSAIDALMAVANIQPGARVDELRKRVIENINRFPMQWLFGCTTYSRDGRVVAKRPPMRIATSDAAAAEEPAVHAGMVRDYGLFLGITVQGSILPALDVLRQEHRLREADFVDLATHSPVVPHGREALFGKGLFAGYEGDFAIAIHLLVPQVEHLVRVHLKRVGATTVKLDGDGIENEVGLSALMEMPEIEKAFDENLAFELRALFCDPSGPNLRNELAHGLMEQDACYSQPVIYAWWLVLKIVFNTWWATKPKGHGD